MTPSIEGGWVEPSADMRALAHTWREMFIALITEGFTETQALHLIGHVIRSVSGGEE